MAQRFSPIIHCSPCRSGSTTVVTNSHFGSIASQRGPVFCHWQQSCCGSGLASRSLDRGARRLTICRVWRAPVAPVGAWRTGVRARLDCRSRGRPSARLLSFNWRSLMVEAETETGVGKLGTETLPAIRRDKKNNPRPSVGLVERPMNRMRGIVSFDRRLLALGCFRLRLSGGARYDSQLLQLVCYKGGAVLGEKRVKAHRKKARSQRSYAQGPLPFLFRR
jgi:hypothetical protein